MIERGARPLGTAALDGASAGVQGARLDRLRTSSAFRDGPPGLRRQRMVPRTARRAPPPPERRRDKLMRRRACLLKFVTCAARSDRSISLPRLPPRGGDWHTIRTLLPYLWAYKGRVLAALTALIAAKVANVGVPVLMKEIVDQPRRDALRDPRGAAARCSSRTARCGCRRRSSPSSASILFAKVTQRAVRTIALEVFRHLHALSLRFHLARGDRRPHARRRTRPARHLDVDQLHAVLDPADAGRDRPRWRDPDRPLRLDVHRDHVRRACALHHLDRDRSPTGAPASAGR